MAEVNASDFENMAEKVLAKSSKVLDSNPTVDSVSSLVGDIGTQLDRDIAAYQAIASKPPACKTGCSWCCHEIVLATPPEIVFLYNHIQGSFSEEEKEALLGRLEEYDRTVAPHRSRPFYFVKAACPLLVNSQCSVYEQRPLICRGRCSTDAEICRMWKEAPGEGGIVQVFIAQYVAYQSCEKALALGFSGRMSSARFELGQCLKMLLEDPTLAQKIIDGVAVFPAPLPKPKPVLFSQDVTTIMPPAGESLVFQHIQAVVDRGVFAEVDALTPKGTLLHLFSRMRQPRIYSSFDQILECRQRFDTALDELGEINIDLQQAVNVLHEHLTLYLPYDGLSSKALLEKQGRVFQERIVSKAYPSLCRPFEKPRREGKFRIGYMSGSLKMSNASRWALGWLRKHGPEFETYAFNLGQDDIYSQLWAAETDHYFRVGGNMHRGAEFIRDLDLDALIFTDIGYHLNDYILYSMRLARTQLTAWGTPVTSGLPSIDFYLSSELMEPENAQEEYTEKLVRLPRSGLCYPRPRSKMPWRKAPLENEDFVPLMAQNIRKWTPQKDYLLKRIYERLGRPIMVLGAVDAPVTEAFSARLNRHGIAHKFLPFENQVTYAQYLQSASISFDPPDWSGGNTTIEALSYGTPVVALPGPYMRGRHSLAFLKIANAEGLIAKDDEDYLDLIFDSDRQHEAMKSLDVDALYEDSGVGEALNKFLLDTLK